MSPDNLYFIDCLREWMGITTLSYWRAKWRWTYRKPNERKRKKNRGKNDH